MKIAKGSILECLACRGLSVTIARIFTAPPDSDTFTAVPEGFVNLQPSLTGNLLLSIGTSLHGIKTGLNIALLAGTKILVIFYASTISPTGVLFFPGVNIIGNSGGGLTIV